MEALPIDDDIANTCRETMARSGRLTIFGRVYNVRWEDMERYGDIGIGTFGRVSQYRYNGVIMAVKQIQTCQNTEADRQNVVQLLIHSTVDNDNIVRCFGYFITNYEIRICMEPMATCLKVLLERTNFAHLPEQIIGKIVEGTLKALIYLKDVHNVMHRDVKPSNILLGHNGAVKLSDFGMSGVLANSIAFTSTAGTLIYRGPERFDARTGRSYDIRSDVWSLGITIVELATGRYPYNQWVGEAQIIEAIINYTAPVLYPIEGRCSFNMSDFVQHCLNKNYEQRPRFHWLQDHPFMVQTRMDNTDIAQWYNNLFDEEV